MRLPRSIAPFAACAALVLATAAAAAPLAGVQSIGPSGAFPSISAAVASLLADGVAEPVTFELTPGVYDEPLAITGPIAGASATNRVRFVSATGNAADVTLRQPVVGADGSDAVVRLAGAGFVTIDHVTLAAGGGSPAPGAALVVLTGGATDVQLADCVLLDPDFGNSTRTRGAVSAAAGATVDRLELRRNAFQGFRNGVVMNSVHAADVVVDSNAFTGGGMFLQYLTGTSTRVTNNVFTANGPLPALELDHNADVAVLQNSVRANDAQALVANLAYGVLTLHNNVLACPNGAPVYTITAPGGVIASDGNDLYTTGTTLATWNGAAPDLAALRLATGQEAHSISCNPGFVSDTDLHTRLGSLDGAGVLGTGVTADIDGAPRDESAPDIGAYEFVALAPLAGTYTVGASSTYPTIAAAVADVVSRGVSALVTFSIKTGTYTEPISLPASIAGTSAVNRVRFVSATGNAADVIVRQPAVQSDGSDAVVRLTGTRFVNLEKLTLQSSGGASSPAPLVNLAGAAADDAILDCVIKDLDHSRYGVLATAGADRLELRRDRFDGCAAAVRLAAATIGGVVVDANTVTGGGTGFAVLSCTGDAPRITNNFVVAAQYGIVVENTTLLVASNSVRAGGGGNAIQAAMFTGTLTMQNDVFAAPDGGFSAVIAWNSSDRVVSDYNDFYTTTQWLASWNGVVPDLAALKAASGQNVHSVSGNPGFTSATDLHTHVKLLDGAGVAVAGVTTDIDGQSRGTPPDIGADEFTPGVPLSGTYVVGSGGAYTTIAAAVSAAMSNGVSGPVTFAIKSGVWTEAIALRGGIAGAGPAARITFTSQTGNAADVTLQRPGNFEDGSDAPASLFGAKFVTLDRLTFVATGDIAPYGAIVSLDGGTTDDRVQYCTLVDATQSRQAFRFGPVADRVELRHNALDGFGTGIAMAGSRSMGGLVVEGNALVGTGTAMVVQGGTGTGAIIANNFVTITSGEATVLQLDNNVDLTVAYNSVNVLGTGAPVGGQQSYGTLRLLNNIFYAAGGGPVCDIGAYGATLVIDYDDWLGWGPVYAYWNGAPVGGIDGLLGSSGQNTHSIFTPPGFTTNTDLHTLVGKLDGVALPMPEVTVDIDGQPRDPAHPDIGADEFTRPNLGVGDVPLAWRLASPVPNPARESFRLAFDLPSAARVHVAVYDVVGRCVAEPAARTFEAGRHTLAVGTASLAPGLYFCRVDAGPWRDVRRIVVGH